MSDQETRVEYMATRLKNNPVVAFFIVFGLIVIGISTFTDAASRMVKLVRDFWANDAIKVTVTVRAPAVRLRWSSSKFWHQSSEMQYENELRLPLSFENAGALRSIIQQVRVLMDSDGHKLTWEGVYEADNLPLAAYAPVDAQIQKHRTQLLPFVISEGNTIVSKTIDFIPIDHPQSLQSGTYRSTLQIKSNASNKWLDLSSFTFTVPSDFTLHGKGPSGVEFYRYDYWQMFDMINEK